MSESSIPCHSNGSEILEKLENDARRAKKKKEERQKSLKSSECQRTFVRLMVATAITQDTHDGKYIEFPAKKILKNRNFIKNCHTNVYEEDDINSLIKGSSIKSLNIVYRDRRGFNNDFFRIRKK